MTSPWTSSGHPHLDHMDGTEISMIRWICEFTLREMKKSAELRDVLRLEPVSLLTASVDRDALDLYNLKEDLKQKTEL